MRCIDDAQVGPWVGVHTCTIVEDRPPCLMHTDMGLRVNGPWLPNDGALCLQVGKVGRPAMHLSNGHLTLWCVCQCWARLPHCVLQCLTPERLQLPASIGGGLDLLRRLMGEGLFHSLVWWRCVMEWWVPICAAVFWFCSS